MFSLNNLIKNISKLCEGELNMVRNHADTLMGQDNGEELSVESDSDQNV